MSDQQENCDCDWVCVCGGGRPAKVTTALEDLRALLAEYRIRERMQPIIEKMEREQKKGKSFDSFMSEDASPRDEWSL